MFIKTLSNVAIWCWQMFNRSEALKAWDDIFISVSYISAGIMWCVAQWKCFCRHISMISFTRSWSALKHVSSCSSSVDSEGHAVSLRCVRSVGLYTHTGKFIWKPNKQLWTLGWLIFQVSFTKKSAFNELVNV